MALSDVGARDRAAEAEAGSYAIEGVNAVLAEFDEYYRWMDKAHEGKLNDQGIDVRKRIAQCRLVLQLLNAALAESREINERGDNAAKAVEGSDDVWAPLSARVEALKPYAERLIELMDLVGLYSEAFYWVAFRAMKAANPLPGLKSLSAAGVRDVRNKLMEHPEGNDSRIFNGGFGYGKPNGPVIAALRTEETPDAWQDAGLFVNADQFFKGFIKVLRAARTA